MNGAGAAGKSRRAWLSRPPCAMLIVTASVSEPAAINPSLLLVALLADIALGYPPFLFRAIGHPVSWIGALIGWLDRTANRPQRTPARNRVAGMLALAVVLVAAILPAWLVQRALMLLVPGWLAPLIGGLLASTLLAQRSLFEHVRDVATGLRTGGLAGGRVAVARIVGRDPQALDAAGVARAAIESLAENFSDGVVAPALWCALFGLPGLAFYKAINTADSMIGHRTPRHASFGWAAARLDDVVNWPAARLAALWLVLAAMLLPAGSPGAALRAIRRDAGQHRSPNAGWPEAAMAGALALRLAGPRAYHGVQTADGWMGDGRAEATPADIIRALALYRRACAVQLAFVLALVLVAPAFMMPAFIVPV
jgi:adenosylcobinamide-phosphate synthase